MGDFGKRGEGSKGYGGKEVTGEITTKFDGQVRSPGSEIHKGGYLYDETQTTEVEKNKCCFVTHKLTLNGIIRCADAVRRYSDTNYPRVGKKGDCITQLYLNKEVDCGRGCPGDSDEKRAEKHKCGYKPCEFWAEESFKKGSTPSRGVLTFKYIHTYTECFKPTVDRPCGEGTCPPKGRTRASYPGYIIRRKCPPSMNNLPSLLSVKDQLKVCGEDEWMNEHLAVALDFTIDHFKSVSIATAESGIPHLKNIIKLGGKLGLVGTALPDDRSLRPYSPMHIVIPVVEVAGEAADVIGSVPSIIIEGAFEAVLRVFDVHREDCTPEQITRLKALGTILNLLTAYKKSGVESLYHEYVMDSINMAEEAALKGEVGEDPLGPTGPQLTNKDAMNSTCPKCFEKDEYKKNALSYCCINYKKDKDGKLKAAGKQLPLPAPNSTFANPPKKHPSSHQSWCGTGANPKGILGLTASEEDFLNGIPHNNDFFCNL